MSAGSEIIREFLVSLGYKIDENETRKFSQSVETASKQVVALGLKATAAATAVMAAVTKIASGLEDLYFVSQRTRASAENIQAFGYAASQMGSSADSAKGSLEAFAAFLRSNPGSYSLVQSIGVQTRQANGDLRDTEEIMQDIGKRLSQMPQYRAIAYANAFGIDYKTLVALEQGTDKFGAQYKVMMARFGLDADKAAKASHNFMVQLRELKATGEILLMTAGNQIIEWIGDLVNWWDTLDVNTRKNIESISAWIGVVASIAAVIASGPIGWIAALGAAILLLWQDFKVWKEGGKSLIDWGKWKPEIDLAKASLSVLGDLARQAGEGFKIMGGWIADAFHWLEKIIDKMEHSTAGKWVMTRIQALHPAVKAVEHGTKEALSEIAGSDQKADKDVNSLTHSVRQVWNQITGQPYEHGHPDTGSSASNPSGATRGIRNNNPGNLIYNSFTRGMGATGADDQGFAIFPTPQAGLNAIAANLRSYGRKGINTASEIAHRWSTTDQAAYTKRLAAALGVDPNKPLNMSDPNVINVLRNGIIMQENGRNPYASELTRDTQAKGVGSSVSLSQKTDIHINGQDSPRATARAIAAEQTLVNDRMVRNFKAAAS